MGGLLDIFIIVYLNNILIYLQNKEEHIDHICQVLECLWKYKLYAKLLKYHFHQKKVKFLSIIVSKDSIEIDTNQIKTIHNWPKP